MLNSQELQSLFEVITDGNKTFEQCLNLFLKSFNKPDQFKACCALCYLLENNLLSKSQRIIAFYILYELYHHENVETTPFAAVVLNSIHTCQQQLANSASAAEDNQFRAEFKLLTDFLVSVPKISKVQVSQYIQDIEKEKDPKPIPAMDIKRIDIQSYMTLHQQKMPSINGPKAYALFGTLREQDDQEDFMPPETGISQEDLEEDELEPHYFIPNFLRPLPVEEFEEESESPHELASDELEPIWLVPGILPEPYWDFNMGQEFNLAQMRQYLSRGFKTQLKDEEAKNLIKGLRTDPELVFHIGLTPQKLPLLVINNPNIAHEVLICMTNTQQITKYYDALSGMKLSPNTLEVFNKLSTQVELPQEFIQVFLKNCMNQCKNSTESKVNKNRMVRLVCVFLQSIIKSKLISIHDVYCDVQSFCIEFSQIKEANAIHKMLQVEKQTSSL